MSHWASTWAYEQDVQPCGRKFVLVALANFADEDGFCYPSQERLAEMTGQDVRSVRRHLASLDKDGAIKRRARRSKTGQRTSDGYTLQAPLSRLKPKRTECPVGQPDKLSPDKLTRDLSENRLDPSVKKDPPLPPSGSYKKRIVPPTKPDPEPPYSGTAFLNALAKFESVQKEIKKPLGPVRRAALYDKLAVWDEGKATQALNEATTGGWSGVFAPKEQNGNGKQRESAAERDARYMRESLAYLNNLPGGGGEDHPGVEARLLPTNVGTSTTRPRY